MSNYTGHTPGPWKWDRDYRGNIRGLEGENYAPVIYLETGEYPGCYVEMDINDANAQLIAAAPDLLDQRNRLREALEAMVEMVDMNGFGKPYAMEIALAALAETALDELTKQAQEDGFYE